MCQLCKLHQSRQLHQLSFISCASVALVVSVAFVSMAAIPRAQIDPSDPPRVDVGAQLSLFCSDMRTEPDELEELKWRRNGERLVTAGNVVVFADTGELVISDIQVSERERYGRGRV